MRSLEFRGEKYWNEKVRSRIQWGGLMDFAKSRKRKRGEGKAVDRSRRESVRGTRKYFEVSITGGIMTGIHEG